MISHLRRTKIIATFGPAITKQLTELSQLDDPSYSEMVKSAYKTTKDCLLSGVNVARLNFSHGSYEEQLIRVKIIREVASELKRPISLMLDTKGPEIRVYEMANKSGEQFNAGDQILINTIEKKIGDHSGFSVTDSTGSYNMAKDVKVDDIILVDDGKLSLKILSVDVENGLIETTAMNNHLLKTNKRINLPTSDYSIPFLSEKDVCDIKFAIEHKFNFIAASFVNSAQNILDIKKILNDHDANHIKVVAKIETRQGIDNLDSILSVADGIMIARGDLGLEVPYYEVPYWGKYIIKKCRFHNVPVIMATQMLDSLEKSIIPTRAECSDVFWAVERGVDATMLSGESAQGQFPVNAIKVMSRLDRQSEIFFDYKRTLEYYYPQIPQFNTKLGEMVNKIAKLIAPTRQVMNEEFEFQAIAVFTNDYEFLKILSCSRPAARVLAFTTDVQLYNSCGLLYGITPILVADLNHAQTHFQDYLTFYFNSHIQTNSCDKITRKTAVILEDQDPIVVDLECDQQILETVEFLHSNF